MIEEWRPISGYETYEVSDLGKIRHGSKLLKPILHGSGDRKYRYVMLCGERRRHVSVAELVLESFHRPRVDGEVACHYPDPDTSNNAFANLRWDSQKNNLKDCHVHGTHRHGSNSYQAKITEGDVDRIRDMLACKVSHRDIAKWFGINCGTVSMIKSGKQWRFHGNSN